MKSKLSERSPQESLPEASLLEITQAWKNGIRYCRSYRGYLATGRQEDFQ